MGAQPGGWGSSEQDERAWRGEGELEPRPEELAGPEYWAYRDRAEIERVVSALVGERTARGR
jgi:hypothetical protein